MLTTLSSFKCAVLYQISSKLNDFFFVEICRFNDFQDPSILNFRNLEFMSRDLYCHALLLSCTKFNSAVEVWPNFFFNGGRPSPTS